MKRHPKGPVSLWAVQIAFVATLLPSLAAAQHGPVLGEVQLQVPFHTQDTLVWCWVAAAKMTAEALGQDTPSQCAMLQSVYGVPCCSQPALCARPGHITEISNLIARFGASLTRMSISGNGFQILNTLKSTRAPIVGYIDNSHFVVITGMKVVQSASGPWGIVRVNDPFRGRSDHDWLTFSQRLSAILSVERSVKSNSSGGQYRSEEDDDDAIARPVGQVRGTARAGSVNTKPPQLAAKSDVLSAHCERGDMDSCANLAYNYSFGFGGLRRDRAEALSLYRKSCDGGSGGGCNGLAMYYEEGLGGLSKDRREAIRLFALACEMRYKPACEHGEDLRRKQ